MKILFVASHPYLPQMHGGMQSSTSQLCSGLMSRGHQVAVLCGLMPGGYFGLKARIGMQINKKLTGHKVIRDIELGYPVWRTWFPWEVMDHVVARERPDLIIVLFVNNGVRIALAAQKTGIPIIARLMDVEFSENHGDFSSLGNIPCMANSRFTAGIYREKFGVDPKVIYPSISAEKYRTSTTKENITFINPHPKKGLSIALSIAKLCPDIPFSFVQSWPLSPEQRRELLQKLSGLPNVTLSSPQKDMRGVYGKCKILLTPSIVEEAYGRVVTEAQISGIPVIASSRGGLPEAVGPGGIILDPESSIENWVEAVRKLWSGDALYAELSGAAIAHAQRQEMNFDYQVAETEKAFLSVLQGN